MIERDQFAGNQQGKALSRTRVTPFVLSLGDELPDIPAMNTTRLRLELLLQESLIDLSAVSRVILSDAGATLQIFRLIGEEFADDESRPTRMEDCIVSLGVERWSRSVCALGLPSNSSLSVEWRYCYRVAQCARELAESVNGFSPEEAYVIGLLCDFGRFPYLLGWNVTGDSPAEHRARGVMLADYWHLPDYLSMAIQEQQSPVLSSRWVDLLSIARRAAMRLECESA